MTPGISGIFPAVTTPFVKGEFSCKYLAFNLQRLDHYGYHGYLILGSTGESVLLSDEEKIAVVEASCALIDEEKKVIIGTGRETAAATIDFTNRVSEYDPDAALVVTPFYYKGQMTAKAFICYYTEIADNTEIPVMIYNVPKFTGLSIPAEAVRKLARHPNICGIKESSGNLAYVAEIMKDRPEGFSVLLGAGGVIYPGLVSGTGGAILAMGNIDCGGYVRLYEAYQSGGFPAAIALQNRLLEVNDLVVGKYGVPGIKYAMDLLGMFGGDPRRPLLPPDDEMKSAIRAMLAKAELLK